MNKEDRKQFEEIHAKLDHINLLIVGNPPKQKGVFQRLDETNGKVKFNRTAIYIILALIVALLIGEPGFVMDLLGLV